MSSSATTACPARWTLRLTCPGPRPPVWLTCPTTRPPWSSPNAKTNTFTLVDVNDTDNVAELAALRAYYLGKKFALGAGDMTVQPPEFDCNAELVQNGSFEAPEVTASKKWDVFGNDGEVDADHVLPGWYVEWVHGNAGAGQGGGNIPAVLELQLAGLNGWTPYEGAQWAELDSDLPAGYSSNHKKTSVKITQTLTTMPGMWYELTFAAKARPNHNGVQHVKVYLGNGVVMNLKKTPGNSPQDELSAGEWRVFTYRFQAGDATTVLGFAEGGDADSFGAFLDNVSVKPLCGYQGDQDVRPGNGHGPGNIH